MENMLTFTGIVIIIFGILQIILFFKVWEMTNDVKTLKDKFVDLANSHKDIPANRSTNTEEFYIWIAAGNEEKAKEVLYKIIAQTSSFKEVLSAKSDAFHKRAVDEINTKFRKELNLLSTKLNFERIRV